jgi:hypothetical protein
MGLNDKKLGIPFAEAEAPRGSKVGIEISTSCLPGICYNDWRP